MQNSMILLRKIKKLELLKEQKKKKHQEDNSEHQCGYLLLKMPELINNYDKLFLIKYLFLLGRFWYNTFPG